MFFHLYTNQLAMPKLNCIFNKYFKDNREILIKVSFLKSEYLFEHP